MFFLKGSQFGMVLCFCPSASPGLLHRLACSDQGITTDDYWHKLHEGKDPMAYSPKSSQKACKAQMLSPQVVGLQLTEFLLLTLALPPVPASRHFLLSPPLVGLPYHSSKAIISSEGTIPDQLVPKGCSLALIHPSLTL